MFFVMMYDMTFLEFSANNGSVLNPGRSCKNILAANRSADSGIYWIKLNASTEAFQVYCDMKTHGGG